MPKEHQIEKYEHPFVTVDVIVFAIQDEKLQVVLIKRGIAPFQGIWALPGGFVRIDESLEEAATRELEEEVGVDNIYLEQLYSFGELGRDPRSRVITVAYYALVNNPSELKLAASTDAEEAAWFPINELPDLAFDHSQIIARAVERLRAKLEYSTVAYALLPDTFSLSQLQKIYEIILGQGIDKRNFRKRMLSLGILEVTEGRTAGAHRPAKLYRFKKKKVQIFN